MEPVVSIVMPTFNRGHFLTETLNSIRSQTFPYWECLIIDDGSSDQTTEILQPILEGDRRFKYFERNNNYLKGPSGCRNFGIDRAQGEYIIFFDSDDIVHPQVLQKSLDLINSSPEFNFCHYGKTPFANDWNPAYLSEGEESTESINTLSLNNINEVVTQEIGFACCTVLWKKKAIGKDRFNEELTYAEEWEYYIRLLLKGLKGVETKEVLYYNRKHPNSNTGEFWSSHPERRASKIQATRLVLKNLKKRGNLSRKVTKHFLRLGFMLKEKQIVKDVLKASEASLTTKISYRLGYAIYPVLKPLFYIKSRIFKF